MRGLLGKIVREVRTPTILLGGALMAVLALLTYVLPQIHQGLRRFLEHAPLARPLLAALLGSEAGERLSAQAMQAFLWVHPTVLAILWAHDIVYCTRVPAGEIDRGTIDTLLGLPVGRGAVYLCETAVWLVSGALVTALGLAGHLLTASAMPPELRPDRALVALVLINLFAVYVAVGGIAWLVSASSNRRGRAIAIAFGLVLASFLVNFLAQFWEPAEAWARLSVLHYYQPAQILQEGKLRVADVALLGTVGLVGWLLGGLVFLRRDIAVS